MERLIPARAPRPGGWVGWSATRGGGNLEVGVPSFQRPTGELGEVGRKKLFHNAQVGLDLRLGAAMMGVAGAGVQAPPPIFDNRIAYRCG